MRNFLAIHVLMDRKISRCAYVGEEQKEPGRSRPNAGPSRPFSAAIGVIQSDEIDLATIHATLVVDHPEVPDLGFAHGTVGRCRTGVGIRIADLESQCLSHPGPYFFCAAAGNAIASYSGERKCDHTKCHQSLPMHANRSRFDLSNEQCEWPRFLYGPTFILAHTTKSYDPQLNASHLVRPLCRESERWERRLHRRRRVGMSESPNSVTFKQAWQNSDRNRRLGATSARLSRSTGAPGRERP